MYRRMALFSLLVVLASLAPGAVLSLMLGWKPLLFGSGPVQAQANFHAIEFALTWVTCSLVYTWFLWPVTKWVGVHALGVFLVVESILFLADLALVGSIADAFVWKPFLLDALYAATGWVLVAGWRFVSRMTPQADQVARSDT